MQPRKCSAPPSKSRPAEIECVQGNLPVVVRKQVDIGALQNARASLLNTWRMLTPDDVLVPPPSTPTAHALICDKCGETFQSHRAATHDRQIAGPDKTALPHSNISARSFILADDASENRPTNTPEWMRATGRTRSRRIVGVPNLGTQSRLGLTDGVLSALSGDFVTTQAHNYRHPKHDAMHGKTLNCWEGG